MSSVDTPYTRPINLSKATVLITGGGTGIGLGLVAEFVAAGSQVIITGRRADVLAEAKKTFPSIHTLISDVASEEQRRSLAKEVISRFPSVNVLINNAGVLYPQTLTGLLGGAPGEDGWVKRQAEIDINVAAPVHLTSLFLPHFLNQAEAAIVYISSYYGFAPSVISPGYSASKAYVHSYALSARQYLAATAVQVVEVSPPLVKTTMSGGTGVEPEAFCRSVVQRFSKGEKEIGFEQSEEVRLADRKALQGYFEAFTAGAAQYGLFKPYEGKVAK